MANEHILMTQKSIPISGTVANGTGIEKGTLLKLADPNTYSASDGTNDIVGGILYTEKIANDGNTQASVLTGPGDELRAIASGSITVGDPLGTLTDFPNYLRTLKGLTELSGGVVLGRSKETATAGQTFKYELNIQSPFWNKL